MNPEIPGNISHGHHAQSRGELLQLITSLRNLGAQAELDLPRIVCIGNQSAGKSSLVEAISGIRVPRDIGTCTRCPLECRLAPSTGQEWTAKVTLRKEYDDKTGERLSKADIIDFIPSITDPFDTELVLRRAQLAILNPSQRPDEFIDMDLNARKTKEEYEFSKNVVCVDISAPNLAQLVFIDLPGIIQNAEEKLVNLVENIVREYIKGNSIILVAIPMTDDLRNQKAALLAEREDRDGRRTIVALTKVDLVGAASTKLRETWLDTIERPGHPVYYATRQLDDGERDTSSVTDAREIEKTFFATKQPWCSSTQKGRFGIPNLTGELSSRLARRISESLPHIHETVKKTLSTTNKALMALPPEITGEPSSEILNLVNNFCKDLEGYVEGNREAEGLIQDNISRYQDFKRSIRSTAPDFRPLETSDEEQVQAVEAFHCNPPSIGIEEEKLTIPNSRPVYLRELRNCIKRAKTRELPNNVPYRVITSLIERYISQWESAVDICLGHIRQNVMEKIEDLITRHFTRFAPLKTRVREILMDKLEACFLETQKLMVLLLSCEKIPYTQNDHYFQSSREKFMSDHISVRQKKKNPQLSALITQHSIVSQSNQSNQSNALAANRYAPIIIQPTSPLENALSALSRVGLQVTAADLNKLTPPDEYEEELVVASQVQAYFQVSYKRIIDTVPMMIDRAFLHGMIKDVQKDLVSKLNIDDKETTRRYLAEDPSVAEERKVLKSRKEKLEQARKHLSEFSITFAT